MKTRYGETHVIACGDPQAPPLALFICGGRDPLGDRDRVVASFMKHGARYEIIEDAGHGINHEHAQDVNRMMLEYFAE